MLDEIDVPTIDMFLCLLGKSSLGVLFFFFEREEQGDDLVLPTVFPLELGDKKDALLNELNKAVISIDFLGRNFEGLEGIPTEVW